MTAFRNLDGTTTASRKGIETIINNFCSGLFGFGSHVHLPPHYLGEVGHVIPEVLQFEVRHTILSVGSRANTLSRKDKASTSEEPSPSTCQHSVSLHVARRNARFLDSG
ncbi:hypothetical protein RB195_019829 [Necator americanus]|uniref:Uncharacterized protein n=1 Tax=Necator americanus TaxID=51031 RepID=A0ABR1CI76_NECAM